MTAPEPVFEAPWHAQVFAMTVHLNETGLFAWSEWTARFSAELADRGLSRELDGGDDYFEAWLATLETYLSRSGIADAVEQSRVRNAWERAYLTTPHGSPVVLPGCR